MTKAFLIVNPRSGNYNSKKIENITEELKKKDIFITEYKLAYDEKISTVIEKIDVKEFPILLLAFGDGTINSACNSLAERNDCKDFKIGIIPMGTANVLSIELGVNNIKKSIEAIVNGKIKKMYLGELYSNDKLKYFTLMASAGVDSTVVFNIDENIKKKIGKFAYVLEFFKVLFKRNFKEIETTIEGKSYKNFLTCVSNSKYYGGKIAIANTNVDKNEFEVIICKKFSILSLLKYLFTKKSKNILTMKSKNIEIKSQNKNFPLQIDGDYYCNLPVQVKITDKYLNVFYN